VDLASPPRQIASMHRRRIVRARWAAIDGAVLLRRGAFALAVAVLVSTQALFQPHLYSPPLARPLLLAWLDYLRECLPMSVSIACALGIAEAATRGRSRKTVLLAVVVALAGGALTGCAIVVASLGLGIEAMGERRAIGDMIYWIAIGGGVTTIHAFQQRASRAAARLHRARVEQVSLGKEMLEARLQVLRAQIEPHFLFNTLANAKRLFQTDVRAGLLMIDNLAHYLRAALPQWRDEQPSLLGQECELVDAYLSILRIRMGRRMRYTIDVPAQARATPFPPMMLLTLVENAIKHGLTPITGEGSVTIDAVVRDGRLEVRVADDGVGFGGAATGGTGVGLANIRARLAALYGDEAELLLAPNAPQGVVATVRMPLSARDVVEGRA